MKRPNAKRTKAPSRREAAKHMSEETADSFSFDRYGEAAWRATILWLLQQGYTYSGVEAIMRSKHTRWAADNANRYSRITSGDFKRYWLKYYPTGSDAALSEVRELTVGTFGFDYQPEVTP